jgi:four helix bundle protein
VGMVERRRGRANGEIPRLDHEKLEVYRLSLEFAAWSAAILERVPKGVAAWKQLDRASTSIALNIAEGNGKFTPADRCRFFDISRGSALESAAALDILVSRGILEPNEVTEGKRKLISIVSMLVGLIRANSPNRVYEALSDYPNTGS